jgi:hypothetical protein
LWCLYIIIYEVYNTYMYIFQQQQKRREIIL